MVICARAVRRHCWHRHPTGDEDEGGRKNEFAAILAVLFSPVAHALEMLWKSVSRAVNPLRTQEGELDTERACAKEWGLDGEQNDMWQYVEDAYGQGTTCGGGASWNWNRSCPNRLMRVWVRCSNLGGKTLQTELTGAEEGNGYWYPAVIGMERSTQWYPLCTAQRARDRSAPCWVHASRVFSSALPPCDAELGHAAADDMDFDPDDASSSEQLQPHGSPPPRQGGELEEVRAVVELLIDALTSTLQTLNEIIDRR